MITIVIPEYIIRSFFVIIIIKSFKFFLFLAIIAIVPAIAKLSGVNDGFAMFFGGTSLLIMVGVVLDTLQQIETYQLNRHMDSLMEGTRVRGRRGANELSGF